MTKWANDLVDELSHVQLPNVFNPYRDTCPLHDRIDAVALRKRNLANYLNSFAPTRSLSIVFGRDFGYRGARRTGLSLTDEAHLDAAQIALKSAPLRKATTGPVVAERTAAVVWNVLARLPTVPVLWNAFPLHPHAPGETMTNRSHSASERRITAWTIDTLVKKLEPTRLIAVGNDAATALADLNLVFECVRHPSYGGQREFIEGMERLHGLPVTGKLKTPRPPTLI